MEKQCHRQHTYDNKDVASFHLQSQGMRVTTSLSVFAKARAVAMASASLCKRDSGTLNRHIAWVSQFSTKASFLNTHLISEPLAKKKFDLASALIFEQYDISFGYIGCVRCQKDPETTSSFPGKS